MVDLPTRTPPPTRAQKTSIALMACGVVLFLWAAIYPYPGLLCLALVGLSPFLALALPVVTRGRWTLFYSDKDKPAVGGLLFLPGLGLGANMLLQEWHLLAGVEPYFAALGLTAVLSLLTFLMRGGVKLETKFILVLILSFWAWGWSTLVFANFLWTSADPVVFRAEVHGKAQRYREIIVESWRYEDGPISYRSSNADYRAVTEGGPVCIVVQTGLLGWRWSYAEACQDATSP